MYDQMYVGISGTKSSLHIKQVGSEMIYKQINDFFFFLYFFFQFLSPDTFVGLKILNENSPNDYRIH